MAREYAPIRLAIWGDDDFRALSPRAQHLYFVLLTSPSLSYCGVADWRPGRIAANATGWSADEVHGAAAELVRGLFIVIDHDTEEVLVRSFVKHDGLLKNPKTSVSMAMAFAGTASATLRGVLVHELVKLHRTQPDLKGWGQEKVRELLSRNAVDPAALPLDYPVGLGVGYPLGLREGLPVDQPVGFGEVQGEGLGEGFLPTPAPAPSSSSIGGYVTGERHQGDVSERNDPPPPRCPDHLHHPNPPACGGCADARREREAHDAAATRAKLERESAEKRRAAEDRARAIAACGMCDADGYLIVDGGGALCSHDPGEAERGARGMAELRAAMGWKAAS
ncbi:hypothetical protein [Nocardia nova]|uniref:hypothetical protein n=1 Tax=Nocardia nova TaxID=37330 RepID=UPI002739FB7A|nr:hypothetical protein [Nocardia nova]